MTSEGEDMKINCVKDLAFDLGFENVDLQFEKGGVYGFLGEVNKIKITGEKNGKKQSLDVVAKHMPQKEFFEKMGICTFYHMEAYMYDKVFSVFDKMQEDCEVSRVLKHATMLKSILEPKKETILMENLSVKGFENFRETDKMGLHHAKLIFEQLGIFHALSFALKHQNPDQFNEMTKNVRESLFDSEKNQDLPQMIIDSFKYAAKVLKNSDAIEKLLEIEEEAAHTYPALLVVEQTGDNAILNHGDMWANNALYKYNGEKLEEVIILDWQTPRKCSPVMDVLFFMLISIDDQVRSEHFELLLSMYYESLAFSLRELKCDPDEVYSYEAYRQDINRLGKVALTHALIMLPIFANDPDDINNCLTVDPADTLPPNPSGRYISKVQGGMDDMIKHSLI